MQDLTATIPHQLSQDEVKRRIREHVGVIRRDHRAVITDLQETWTGDTMAFSLKALGQTISGRLTVDAQVVHLTMSLPWLLRMIAGTLVPKIEQQGRLLLGHQEDGSSP